MIDVYDWNENDKKALPFGFRNVFWSFCETKNRIVMRNLHTQQYLLRYLVLGASENRANVFFIKKVVSKSTIDSDSQSSE